MAEHGKRIILAQLGGKALISGAMNNSPTGPDLYLVDSNGNLEKDAWLLLSAICPNPANGFKGEVELMSGLNGLGFARR